MVKLTPEIIENAAQRTNQAIRERELDLRGYKLSAIESLGATLDQFDVIDFTDNDIRKMDGFPILRRLKWLLFSNNRIAHFGDRLDEYVPNLEWLILTNNNIQELNEIDKLSGLTNLQYLCFLGNPVCTKKYYRLYVIGKIPSVRRLDFRRVKQKERHAAKKLMKSLGMNQAAESANGNGNGHGIAESHDGAQKRNMSESGGAKTFTPGEPIAKKSSTAAAMGLTPEEIVQIKRAITQASTLVEIERLQQMLRQGQVPSTLAVSQDGNGNGAEETESA